MPFSYQYQPLEPQQVEVYSQGQVVVQLKVPQPQPDSSANEATTATIISIFFMMRPCWFGYK